MAEPHTHGGTDAPECTTCRPTLDPAHVEAIGKVAGEALIFGDVVPDDMERHRIRDLLNAQAEAILTSIDPAVHAALLAALVRAGMPDDRTEAEIRADEIEHILTHILTGPRSPATNALERRLAELRHE